MSEPKREREDSPNAAQVDDIHRGAQVRRLEQGTQRLEQAIASSQAMVMINTAIVEYVTRRLCNPSEDVEVNTTSWPDLTRMYFERIRSKKEISEDDLRDAKQDLDRVETRLRDAKQDLRDAETCLDRAKQDLRDAEHRLREGKEDPWLGATKAFCEAILTATEAAPTAAMRTVEIGGSLTWLVEHEKVLYERVSVVEALWTQVQELGNFRSIVVCGNPGIGKSVGLINAMLRRLLAVTRGPAEYVVVVTRSTTHIFDHSGQCLQMSQAEAAPVLASATCVWLLHDIKTDSLYNHAIWCHVSRVLRLVLFTSPQERNYHTAVQDVKKKAYFYVPTWSFEDLKVMIPSVTQEAFDAVGGIPRHIDLATGAANLSCIQDQDFALVDFDFTTFDVHEKVTESSKILCIVPSATFDNISHMDFVSKRAAKEFARKAAVAKLATLQSLLLELLANNSMRCGYAGYAFESYFLRHYMGGFLKPDKALVCQHLAGQAPAILLRDCPTKDFGGLSELLTTSKPTLFLPSTSNFACFDAFLIDGSDVTAFQVTLAESHAPKQLGMHKIKQHLDGVKMVLKRIVWVTDAGSKLQSEQKVGKVPEDSQINDLVVCFAKDGVTVTPQAARNLVKKSALALLGDAAQYRLILPIKVETVVQCTVAKQETKLLLGKLTLEAVQQEVAQSKLFAANAKVDCVNEAISSDGALHFKVT